MLSQAVQAVPTMHLSMHVQLNVTCFVITCNVTSAACFTLMLVVHADAGYASTTLQVSFRVLCDAAGMSFLCWRQRPLQEHSRAF